MQKAIALTMGDAAGIGPEIIVKAFQQEPELTRGCFVVGDLATLQRAAHLVCGSKKVGMPVALIDDPDEALEMPPNCLPVLQVDGLQGLVPFGQVSAEAGRLAGRCVIWAAQAALHKQVAAIVTAPLHKQSLSVAGPPFDQFPGHTEILQFEAAEFAGLTMEQLPVRMMLANQELKVVLVSIHVSLRHAIAAVSFDNVLGTLKIAHESFLRMWGRAPRIGVAGLNPHAGEGGLFGSEETDIIAPAVSSARASGIDAMGPYAPDTIFMRARAEGSEKPEFDLVLAMYHDQGLIPIKYLGVEKGVNLTLGLPIVRTSPDHGTAFDIAGSGRADPSSMIEALRMAKLFATSR